MWFLGFILYLYIKKVPETNCLIIVSGTNKIIYNRMKIYFSLPNTLNLFISSGVINKSANSAETIPDTANTPRKK